MLSLEPGASPPEEPQRRDRLIADALRVLGQLPEREARALDEAVTALRARWR